MENIAEQNSKAIKIQSKDELISEAKKIQSIDERIHFIMDYFLENVRYNYAYLFLGGYAMGTISSVSNELDIIENKTKADGDERFSIPRYVTKGESAIFNNILQIRDQNSGNYDNFIKALKDYVEKELKSHLDNENVVSQNVEIVIQKIEKGLRRKKIFNSKGEDYSFNYDISKVLIDFILEEKEVHKDFLSEFNTNDEGKMVYRNFPPEFNNGIITNGVCRDYEKYLVPILNETGIEAYSVVGTSELIHHWIIVNSENGYKSVDLTRAVFIRDGFKGIPPEQTSQDWLFSDMKKIFEMQKTRTITKIDNIELKTPITPDNFNEEDFNNLMKDIKQGKVKDSTLKQILEQSLKEDGISKEECKNAENYEQSINREEKENEH